MSLKNFSNIVLLHKYPDKVGFIIWHVLSTSFLSSFSSHRVKMLDSLFNIDNGYLEGLVRGFKNGILKQTDYLNLVQCESLDGKAETTEEFNQ